MLTKYINPKTFLIAAGVILLLIGVLGFLGILGPGADKSVFKAMWWFDNYESAAHAALGVLALVAAFVMPAAWQRYMVFVYSAIGFFFGVYSLFMVEFGPVSLQNPADTILHLVLGAWALWAAMEEAEVITKKK